MLNKFDKILMVGLLAPGLAYLTADEIAGKIREPMPPPAAYQKISAGQYKHHSGENVETSATPVFVHHTIYGGLEVGLREGDVFLKAFSSGIDSGMFSFRPPNKIYPEKIEEVFEEIKGKILAGESKPITLRGTLGRRGTLVGGGTLGSDVLYVHGINIDSTDYYLLQHK